MQGTVSIWLARWAPTCQLPQLPMSRSWKGSSGTSQEGGGTGQCTAAEAAAVLVCTWVPLLPKTAWLCPPSDKTQSELAHNPRICPGRLGCAQWPCSRGCPTWKLASMPSKRYSSDAWAAAVSRKEGLCLPEALGWKGLPPFSAARIPNARTATSPIARIASRPRASPLSLGRRGGGSRCQDLTASRCRQCCASAAPG